MCHLKSLIFDCLSFTEDLITSSFTADSEAQRLILKIFVTKNDFLWDDDN
jgi:hypothetical protein